jgi:predicted RNA binding protein YcfA (HicA-like mRNA interferase family)
VKIPRDLSGRNLIGALCRHWNYRQISQEGSHVILVTDEPSHQRIAIPDHTVLRVGTLNAILRAVSQHKNVVKSDVIDSI